MKTRTRAICLVLLTLLLPLIPATAEWSDASVETLVQQAQTLTAQVLKNTAFVMKLPTFKAQDKSYQKACKYLAKLKPEAIPDKALLVPATEDMLLTTLVSAFPVAVSKESLMALLPDFLRTFAGAATTQKYQYYPKLIGDLMPTVTMKPMEDVSEYLLAFLIYSQDLSVTLFTASPDGLTAQSAFILSDKKRVKKFNLEYATDFAKTNMGIELPAECVYLEGDELTALLSR